MKDSSREIGAQIRTNFKFWVESVHVALPQKSGGITPCPILLQHRDQRSTISLRSSLAQIVSEGHRCLSERLFAVFALHSVCGRDIVSLLPQSVAEFGQICTEPINSCLIDYAVARSHRHNSTGISVLQSCLRY